MNPLGLWTRLCVLATAGLIALGPLACCCVRSATFGGECAALPAGDVAECCSACCALPEPAGDEDVAATCCPPDEDCRCTNCGLSVSAGPIPPTAVREIDLPGDLWVPFVSLAELAPPPAPILPASIRRERSPTLPVATGREWLAWACILRC